MAARRRRVIWTEQARDALNEALEYIAQDSPSGAREFLTDCLDAAASLAELSQRGQVVEEANRPEIRQLLVQRYRLLYEVQDAKIFILALLHGSRDFSAWLRMGGLEPLNGRGDR